MPTNLMIFGLLIVAPLAKLIESAIIQIIVKLIRVIIEQLLFVMRNHLIRAFKKTRNCLALALGRSANCDYALKLS